MKVLSLTEPYASLILTGHKKIETRSWKTNYRGELYIHASITKIAHDERTKELENLLGNSKLNFGYILCKCKLVDCVFMTTDFIEKLKNANEKEYLCGEYKEGRYAWILEDIKPIKRILAKGALGLWDFYSPEEIMEFMEDIEYGWVDKEKKKYKEVDDGFSESYRLQSPKEIQNSKVGVCWDQVELERYYFKGYQIKTFFIVHYDNQKCPTHTFLTYQKNDKYYWFEHAWEKYRGIYCYTNLEELLNSVKLKFIKDLEDYNPNNLYLYEYKKPNYTISTQAFYQFCEESKKINLDDTI